MIFNRLKETFFVLLLVINIVNAQSGNVPNNTEQPLGSEFQPPRLPVRSWLLMDAENGDVLAEMNGYMPLEPASITKIMTSYVISDALKNNEIHLRDIVTISKNAYKQEGSRMFIEDKSKISVENLMKGMIVHSGNDATIALVEFLTGTEENFVDRMNSTAQKIGLKNSYFKNTTGLPDKEHVMTAYDIALLSRHLINDHPESYKLYSIKEFTWNKITQSNRNKLLFTDPTVDGIKTGHTNSAGYGLVSSSTRKGFRLIAVVLGAKQEEDRYEASRKLLQFGYQHFDKKKVFLAEKAIDHLPVLDGKQDQLSVGLARDLVLLLNVNEKNTELQAHIEFNQIKAPIKKGDIVGTLVITQNEKVKASKPLIALSSIEEGGIIRSFFSRLKYKITSRHLKKKFI